MMDKGPILIVDNNRNLCGSLLLILEKKNYVVQCTYTASEGLEKAKDNKFILTLLDSRLPSMDGHNLLQ